MAQLESWYQSILPWLPLLSISGLIMAIVSVIALPWVVVRMPADYFVTVRQAKYDRSALGWLVWLLRNSLATVLLFVGLLLLVLPGQGLLMILIALGVSTSRHKYSIERSIISRKAVFKTVNWIRKRFQRNPIIHPDEPDKHTDKHTGTRPDA